MGDYALIIINLTFNSIAIQQISLIYFPKQGFYVAENVKKLFVLFHRSS